jgi:hypothetical protein
MKKVLDIFGVGGASAITDKNSGQKKTKMDIKLENEIERAVNQYGMRPMDSNEQPDFVIN